MIMHSNYEIQVVSLPTRRKNDLDSDDDDDEDEIDAEEALGFRRVDSDKSEADEASLDSEDDSDEDGFAGAKVRGELYERDEKVKEIGADPSEAREETEEC
jgi:hypothetical protein